MAVYLVRCMCAACGVEDYFAYEHCCFCLSVKFNYCKPKVNIRRMNESAFVSGTAVTLYKLHGLPYFSLYRTNE